MSEASPYLGELSTGTDFGTVMATLLGRIVYRVLVAGEGSSYVVEDVVHDVIVVHRPGETR